MRSLRSRRAGGARPGGGADHGEWESEQGGEAESPEQRGAQVLALGSAVAEPEQPAVDRIQSQRRGSGSCALPPHLRIQPSSWRGEFGGQRPAGAGQPV
jgi:hypothetical protein